MKYDKYDDEKRKAMIKYALSSVKNIQNLLFNLLNWARSQSGTIKFRPEETFIEDVITSYSIHYTKLYDTQKFRRGHPGCF